MKLRWRRRNATARRRSGFSRSWTKRSRIRFRPAIRFRSSRPRPRKRGTTPILRRLDLQSRALAVDSLQDHRPPPDAVDVFQYLATAFEIEPAAIDLVVVIQLERAVHPHVPGADTRRAEVVLLMQQALVQRRQLVLEHLDLAIRARVEAEQAELVRELPCQVIADEAEVVVLLHDRARGVEPLLLDDLLPHREAEVIRIHVERDLLVGRDRAHDIRMALDR